MHPNNNVYLDIIINTRTLLLGISQQFGTVDIPYLAIVEGRFTVTLDTTIKKYDKKNGLVAVELLCSSFLWYVGRTYGEQLDSTLCQLLLQAQDERQLPMKMYVPYSMVKLLPYLLTYLEQAVAIIYGISIDIVLHSLVYGFTILACGQIDLLCYRLSETFRFLQLQDNSEEKGDDTIEKFAIAECVRHHNSVCNIIHRIQSLFMWSTAILFFTSFITLCSSIYQISNKELFSIEFLFFVVYVVSISFQLFLYCWYGNELDLKYKDIASTIYASNWTAISVKQRRSLSFIMMISQRGQIISFYGFCSLVISTFTGILQTSYSAFNLLQRVSN